MSQAQTVITIVVLAVISLIGIAILSSVGGIAIQESGNDIVADVLEPPPDQYIQINDGNIDTVRDGEVTPTTADAASLSTDGYIDASAIPDSTYDGNFTAGVTVEPGDDLDQSSTASIFAANNQTIHLMLEKGDYTARYDDGAETAYTATDADLSAKTRLSVAVNESDGRLQLYKNGSLVDSNTTGTSTQSHRHPVSWQGSVDELRVWSALGNGESNYATAYGDDPVQPIGPADTAGRAMFNANDRDKLFRANDDLDFVAEVSFVNGLPAGETITDGDEYDIKTDPIEFRVNDGYLSGQPIVFINFDSIGIANSGSVTSLVGGVADAFELIPILLLVLAAGLVITTVQRLRSSRRF